MADIWIQEQLKKQHRVLNEKELAAELGLSAWTVRRFRLQGGMPCFWVGGRVFFRLPSVLAWLDKQEQGEQPAPVAQIGVLRRVD